MPELTLEVLDQRQRHLTEAYDILRARVNETWRLDARVVQLEVKEERLASAEQSLRSLVDEVQRGRLDLDKRVRPLEAAHFITVEVWSDALREFVTRFDKRLAAQLKPWSGVRKNLEARVTVLEKPAWTIAGPCGDAARQQKEQQLRVSRVTWTRAMGTEAFQ